MEKIILNSDENTKFLRLSNEVARIYFSNIKFSSKTHNGGSYQLKCLIKNVYDEERTVLISSERSHIVESDYVMTKWNDTGILQDIRLPIYSISISTLPKLKPGVIARFNVIFNNYLPVNNPIKKFSHHLEEAGNSRILFSAPFGQGKTTFLKLFFEDKVKVYNCFNLYPVNYSIADNKDILEYIKFAILYELLLRDDLEFRKEEISHLQKIPKFALKNADKLLGPFLRLIPSIGGSLADIYENLIKLSKEYFGEIQNEKSMTQKRHMILYNYSMKKKGQSTRIIFTHN